MYADTWQSVYIRLLWGRGAGPTAPLTRPIIIMHARQVKCIHKLCKIFAYLGCTQTFPSGGYQGGEEEMR